MQEFDLDDFSATAPAIKKKDKNGITINGVFYSFDTIILPNDLINQSYHSAPGISASGIKKAWNDPKLLKKKDSLMRMPSPALDIGTALHEALLEPESFDVEKYGFTKLQHQKIEVMINNGKVMFDYILKYSQNEISFFHQDEGFIRKCRVDAYDPLLGIIYDVKTSRYNNINKFIRDAYDLGYHLQAAYYIDTLRACGFKVDYFSFLVIPSESPCEPFAVQITDRFIEDGREAYGDVIGTYLEYEKSGSEKVMFKMMDLPKWRLEQLGLGY